MNSQIKTIILVFVLFWQWLGFSQAITDADAAFLAARDLAFNGERTAARKALGQLLDHFPQYTDATLLMAKTHSWDGHYKKARGLLNSITSAKRQHRAAWVAAIKNEVYAQNPQIAYGLANKALVYLKEDVEISSLKEDLWRQLNQEMPILEQQKEVNRTEKRKNTLAVASQMEIFDVVFDPMYAASITYQHSSAIGKILPRLNYAKRFNIEGLQLELDAYPKISKTLSGYLNYGYANTPIFPKHRVGAELYAELPKALELSAGGRYLDFNTLSATIFTASFGMYRGNYYWSARPYFSVRSDQQLSWSGTLLARKYGRDGDHYIGIRAGYGFDAELNQFIVDGQLLAQTQLFLEAQQLQLEYQFANKDNSGVYTLNAGVRRQELAFSSGNYYWAVAAGLQYKFRF